MCQSHHVVEDEARVGQLEVLEQAVELPAVERAPGTVQVVSGLRLLSGVVVVLELHRGRRTVSAAHPPPTLRPARGGDVRTHLVEDAKLLSRLGGHLLSSALHVGVKRLLDGCGKREVSPTALTHLTDQVWSLRLFYSVSAQSPNFRCQPVETQPKL